MIRAYAKINLGLQILHKREDGYHDIETILHPVNICDEISFGRCDDIRVECDHPDVPTDSSNLCCRAAEILQQSLGIKSGVRIRLEKRIPVGAGLGGGSSDAAAVLKHLPRYWQVQGTSALVRELAVSLGSDVSYFLHPGTAKAMGRGEILEYFDFELPYWVVVVHPDIRVSTTWAYQNFRANPSAKRVDLKDLLVENRTRPNVLINRLRNDFEPIVFHAHELVMRAKEALYRGGADFALMSGSGSSVFGLFQDDVLAKDVVKLLQDTYQVFLTEPYFMPGDG
ncbi:MAG: 4-(cytidine 5'-diphospho)-2-C-methyl-D-erythritol kinase [Bacteroidota bacterium]